MQGSLWGCPASCDWRCTYRFLQWGVGEIIKQTKRPLSLISMNWMQTRHPVSLPRIPISTAGSLEGICCRKGRISSMTNHLSRYSKIFPRHTSEFTLTCTVRKDDMHSKKGQVVIPSDWDRGKTAENVSEHGREAWKVQVVSRIWLKETYSKWWGL